MAGERNSAIEEAKRRARQQALSESAGTTTGRTSGRTAAGRSSSVSARDAGTRTASGSTARSGAAGAKTVVRDTQESRRASADAGRGAQKSSAKSGEKEAAKAGNAAKNGAKSASGKSSGAKKGAGKSGKTKLSVRMKRNIRRSVAGVCLASSLLIAAIPGDRSGTAEAAQREGMELFDKINALNPGMNYTDDHKNATEIKVNYSMPSLEGAQADSVSGYSYVINDMGQMEHMFHYYTDKIGSSSDPSAGAADSVGVIDGISNANTVNLSISNIICLSYDYYTPAEYSEWLNENYRQYRYEITGNDPRKDSVDLYEDVTGSTDIKKTISLSELIEIFPEASNLNTELLAAFAKYRTDHNGEEANFETLVQQSYWPNNAVKLVYHGSDIENQNLETLFLSRHASRLNGRRFDSDYELVDVSTVNLDTLDKIDANGNLSDTPLTGESLPSVIYVIKYNGTINPNMMDENGYCYAKMTNAVAIANNAFFNKLSNCVSVSLASSILYVGDAAFGSNRNIAKVDFPGVVYIGNDVFNGCQGLSEVNLSNATQTIGNQAFYSCKSLTSFQVPDMVSVIGFGAFAECSNLANVSLTTNQSCEIRDYAFYNTTALSSVSFPAGTATISLGKACFAVDEDNNSSVLQSFEFPQALIPRNIQRSNSTLYTLYGADTDLSTSPATIKSPTTDATTITDVTDATKDDLEYESRLGDYLFANRDSLTSVILHDIGAGSSVERLPMNTFAGCSRLNELRMDAGETMLAMDANIFRDVENSELCVYGPATSNSNTGLRDASGLYYAKPRLSTWATYSAVTNYVPYCYGDHFEVGMDGYLYDLDVAEDRTATITSCSFIGPAHEVGTTEKAPFSIPQTVAGYRVTALADENTLKDIKNYIVYLEIPDGTLEVIGDKVFDGCALLEGVKIGDSVTMIGTNAFSNNPKLAKVTIGKNIESVGINAFFTCPLLTDVYWDVPDDTETLNYIGSNAFKTMSKDGKLYFHGYAEDDTYEPFEYAMGGNYTNGAVRICYMSPLPVDVNDLELTDTEKQRLQTMSIIYDEVAGAPLLIDYMHFTDLPKSVQAKVTGNEPRTPAEEQLLNYTEYLQIPAAVKSIDIASFLSDENTNALNKSNWIYIDDTVDFAGLSVSVSRIKVYGDMSVSGNLTEAQGQDKYHPGLFSGLTNDAEKIRAYDDSTFTAVSPRGNDWIRSISLPGVTEIPEYAFDSCERLQSVIIGDDCTEVGKLAFQDCMELTSIGTSNNPIFSFDNYLLYEKSEDEENPEAVIINTCLPRRGTGGASSTELWINPENDPSLANVTGIKDSAFEGCQGIEEVDLGDTTIKTIGESCFEGCKALGTVVLPDTVKSIGDEAFAHCDDRFDVTIPGDKTYLTKGAFDTVSSVTIHTYHDSIADTVALDSLTDNINVKYLGESYTVRFRNDDNTVIELQYVDKGANGTVPDGAPISAKDATATFTGWTWTNNGTTVSGNATVRDVQEDRDIYAQYEYKDQKFTVTFKNDDMSTISVQNVTAGELAVQPRDPSSVNHPGASFLRWGVVSGDEYPFNSGVTQDTVMIAIYDTSNSSSASGNSASGNSSGSNGSNGTNGSNGSGGSSSGSNGSASSNSASNNSASSNSVSENGYLVTVENGAGTARYQPGAVVTITAYAPTEGRVFDRWTTSNADIGFSNMYASSTTFIMPTHDVKVTATYKSATASGNSASGNTTTGGNTNGSGTTGGSGTASGNTTNRNTGGGSTGGGNNGNTDVVVTTDTIDNNVKNIASATVAGSTDNFVLKITDSAAAAAAVEQALRNRYGADFDRIKYAAFDISLYDSTGTNLVANANDLAVTVTIPIPDELRSYAGNNRAGAVINGTLNDLGVSYTTIDGVPCMRFTATHFSPYTIYVDTGNVVRGMADDTPKTGDGIAPKWFLSAGMLSLSCVLFLWKDKKQLPA